MQFNTIAKINSKASIRSCRENYARPAAKNKQNILVLWNGAGEERKQNIVWRLGMQFSRKPVSTLHEYTNSLL